MVVGSSHFKGPMLAANALPTGDMSDRAVQAAIAKLRFPLLASPKLDGIRAVILDGKVYSRSKKLIPNKYIQHMLGDEPYLEGFDGELIVGDATDPNAMQNTSSGVRSVDGEPDFTFHVFDTVHPNYIGMSFNSRLFQVRQVSGLEYVQPVRHVSIHSAEELLEFELGALTEGYEGVMLRDPIGAYKQGRSTLIEGGLLKWKRMVDGEAEIVGYVEQMQNNNVATKNELGRTQRLGGKANHTGKGTFGAFVCKLPDGTQFQIGTGKGLNDDLRRRLWAVRETLPGEYLKFECFAATGVKDKPRFPRVKKLLGVRWQGDM